jgi:hypothetical protein
VSGNVYLTGSAKIDTSADIITLKYDSDGNLLWAATYNGVGYGNDAGTDIIVDDNNDVYITGFETNTT